MELSKEDKELVEKYEKVTYDIHKAMKGLKVIESIALLEEIKIDIIMNKVVKINGALGNIEKE